MQPRFRCSVWTCGETPVRTIGVTTPAYECPRALRTGHHVHCRAQKHVRATSFDLVGSASISISTRLNQSFAASPQTAQLEARSTSAAVAAVGRQWSHTGAAWSCHRPLAGRR